jgi:hypothetical protein
MNELAATLALAAVAAGHVAAQTSVGVSVGIYQPGPTAASISAITRRPRWSTRSLS